MPFKEIYLSQSTVLNTIVWKRFCGLHYPDDLITSTLSHGSPPAIQKDLILSGSNPEIQLENLLLCFVHEVSSTLPTGILSYAECYLIHTQKDLFSLLNLQLPLLNRRHELTSVIRKLTLFSTFYT